MRYQRALFTVSAALVLVAPPAWSQGGGMMGRGGMMGGGDSTTSSVMQVVHELIMNHEKLRRTVSNLPNGVRTVTESDDPTMAQQIKAHVAATGAFVAKAVDPNLPMSTPSLHGVLRNGARIVRETSETAKGIVVTETSTDPATVALLQTHAAEVTDLVNRGMVAAQESMMGGRGMPPRSDMPAMQHEAVSLTPTLAGQAAFATVQEIVKILEADPATDWSKVDLEALRQHLIDMDAVTMRARVKQTPISGGLSMDVTGEPSVAASARRVLSAHAPMLESMGGWRAAALPIASGIRLTVVALNPADSVLVARIRGLGLIGLMTEGEHHTAHHLMIAKGAGAAAHSHGTP